MEGGEIPGARTLVHTGGRQRLTNRTDKTRPLFEDVALPRNRQCVASDGDRYLFVRLEIGLRIRYLLHPLPSLTSLFSVINISISIIRG